MLFVAAALKPGGSQVGFFSCTVKNSVLRIWTAPHNTDEPGVSLPLPCFHVCRSEDTPENSADGSFLGDNDIKDNHRRC